jgi:hypothetical protein
MKSGKVLQVGYVFVLALLLFVAMFAAINVIAAPPAEVNAEAVSGTSTSVSLGATVNYTGSATYNGTGVNAINYGTADCYNYLVIYPGASQRVTTTLQHAINSGQWVDLVSFTALTTDSVNFTTTVPYGRFIRAQLAISDTTSPITASVSCVLKNRTQ